jgi:hypothetical protein
MTAEMFEKAESQHLLVGLLRDFLAPIADTNPVYEAAQKAAARLAVRKIAVRFRDGRTEARSELPNDGDAVLAVDSNAGRAWVREGSGYEAPWREVS